MPIRYELIIYWSEEDQAFLVEVPELPGCMADGKTYETAVANAQQVIQEWLETAEELDRPVPEPRGRLMYARPYRFEAPGLIPLNSASTRFSRLTPANSTAVLRR